jgi:hypothetical protein
MEVAILNSDETNCRTRKVIWGKEDHHITKMLPILQGEITVLKNRTSKYVRQNLWNFKEK